MANHKSALKRARQSEKRYDRNRAIKGHLRTVVRAFREAVAEGNEEKTKETLGVATRAIRKAASKGVLHTRTASRRVSRLAQAVRGA